MKKLQVHSKKIEDLDIGITPVRFDKNSTAFDFKLLNLKKKVKDILKFVESNARICF